MNLYGLSWAGYWLGLVLLVIVGVVCPSWWPWAIPGGAVVLASVVGVAMTHPAQFSDDDYDDVRL